MTTDKTMKTKLKTIIIALTVIIITGCATHQYHFGNSRWMNRDELVYCFGKAKANKIIETSQQRNRNGIYEYRINNNKQGY